MKFSNYYYLIVTLFFGGLTNIRLWYSHGPFLKRHWGKIAAFVLATLPIAAIESVDLRWKAWAYDPSHTLHTKVFGAELETYIFMAVVAAGIGGATLAYAAREDESRNHRTKKAHIKKQQRSTLRRLFGAAGATRR